VREDLEKRPTNCSINQSRADAIDVHLSGFEKVKQVKILH
jgi:hypothetical protein